jgi:hypothetical protein
MKGKEHMKDQIPTTAWSPEKLGEYCLLANQRMADEAWRIGRALIIAKSKLKHGEWLAWLKRYCPTLSAATRSRYRRLAEQFGEADLQGVGLVEAYRRAGLVKSPSPRKTATAPTDWLQPAVETQCMAEGKRDLPPPQTQEATTQDQHISPVTGPWDDDDQLDPASALADVVVGLSHRIRLLRQDIEFIKSQDRMMRTSCWAEYNGDGVARLVVGLLADLAWLADDVRQGLPA